MKIQYHYAPLTGALSKVIDGEHQPIKSTYAFHALMEEFQTKRCLEINLVKTVDYGHPHFNGHRGRVDIYE